VDQSWAFVGIAVILLLQSILIGGWLIQRRRVAGALRRSADQVRDLAGQVIAAQETERARLARELHDDIGQRVAALSIAVSGIRRRREIQAHPDLRAALESLQQRSSALAEGIRQLSHDLHPSVLDHVLLSEALQDHCNEFARQHNLPVTFAADADLGRIDGASALCLYRVAQEALRNVAKHAHAHSVHVALRKSGDEMALSIVDDGIGFDYGAAHRHGAGLGLRSIEERVRLARGHIIVDSKQSAGTTVSAHLPIECQTSMPDVTAKGQ
jgi:signal transduction histidine kinase